MNIYRTVFLNLVASLAVYNSILNKTLSIFCILMHLQDEMTKNDLLLEKNESLIE